MFTLQAVHPLAHGVSVTQLALFVGLTGAATTALEVPTGLLADRTSRKLTVSLGFLCDGFAFGGYALIDGFWTLLPIAVLLALGTSLKSGAIEALIYDDLQPAGRADQYFAVTSRAASLRNLTGVFAALAGPVLYVAAEPAPFLLSAAGSLVAAAIVLSFDERPRPEATRVPHLLDGLGRIARSRSLRLLAAIEVLMLLFVNLYYQVLFFPRLTSFGLDIELLGVVDVAMLGLAALALMALPRLLGRRSVTTNLVLTTALAAGAFVAFAVSEVLALALAFGILFDLVWSARAPVQSAYANRHLGSKDRALVLSSLSFAGNLGAALLLPFAAVVLAGSDWYSLLPLALVVMLLVWLQRGRGR